MVTPTSYRLVHMTSQCFEAYTPPQSQDQILIALAHEIIHHRDKRGDHKRKLLDDSRFVEAYKKLVFSGKFKFFAASDDQLQRPINTKLKQAPWNVRNYTR